MKPDGIFVRTFSVVSCLLVFIDLPLMIRNIKDNQELFFLHLGLMIAGVVGILICAAIIFYHKRDKKTKDDSRSED